MGQVDDVLASLNPVASRQLQDIILFSDGIALKSKLSRLLTTGNFADLILRSTMRRTRVAAPKVAAFHGGKKVAQSASEITSPHVPAPEARVDIAHWVSGDVLSVFFVDLVQRCGIFWQAGLKPGAHILRHRRPNGAFAHLGQVFRGLIHHAMCERAGGFPILRVKCFFLGILHMPHPTGSNQSVREEGSFC